MLSLKKLLGPEKIWGPKEFESQNFRSENIFISKIDFGPKKIFVWKNIHIQNRFWVRRKFLSQKIVGKKM